MLVDLRNRNAAGRVFTDIPLLRGTPRLGYLWSWSVGMERQVMPNVAVSVDYVGNVGHDQTGTIDINEGPVGRRRRGDLAGHRRVRSDGHEDSGGGARRELPARPGVSDADAFNTDYHALELGVVKRMANRWSGRVSYTLARARDVNVDHRECLCRLGPAGQRRLRRDERAQPARRTTAWRTRTTGTRSRPAATGTSGAGWASGRPSCTTPAIR